MKTIGFLALAGLVACGGAKAPGYTTSAGSLALSGDDHFLYAVDTDNNLLAVIDTAQNQKIAEITVGAAPARVVVGPDDTVYVSNRGERSVSVIHRGTWSEAARIPVGVEPTGMAVSPDGKTLYVVNSTALDTPTEGSVMAIDTTTLQNKWEVKVGEEPRGIRLIDDHTAAVTLLKQGDVVFVDLQKVTATAGLSAQIHSALNASGSSSTFGPARSVSSFRQRVMADLAVTPDGKRLYVPTLLDREEPIGQAGNTETYSYGSGGPCAVGPIATAGVVTIDAQAKAPKVDDLTQCGFGFNQQISGSADFPPTALGTPNPGTPIQGPTVAVVDPTGAWLFVVNKDSNNVAVLPAYSRQADQSSFLSTGSSVHDLVQNVGAAPDGIALTRDGNTAYVYSQLDHAVALLGPDGSGHIVVQSKIPVAQDPASFTTAFLNGRRHFFDASDSRMTNLTTTGVSCNTCHVEGGREDGHVWQAPDGPRQTPSLAGRMILQTAPYHWSGVFPDLNSFLNHTIQTRMGGVGLDSQIESEIAEYIGGLQLPDNPLRSTQPTAQQQRGALVFTQAGCDACHSGQALTNNGFANVGTFDFDSTTTQNPDDPTVVATGLNVPSLLGLGRTAPYLHDGSQANIGDRLAMAQDPAHPHGNLAGLSQAQLDDLTAYLESL